MRKFIRLPNPEGKDMIFFLDKLFHLMDTKDSLVEIYYGDSNVMETDVSIDDLYDQLEGLCLGRYIKLKNDYGSCIIPATHIDGIFTDTETNTWIDTINSGTENVSDTVDEILDKMKKAFERSRQI